MKPMSQPLTRSAAHVAMALAAALALGPSLASASTAANTTLTNTVTVTYENDAGIPQAPVQASATVTVTLVPSQVALSSPGVQTILQGATATLSYTITSTANGPDVYDLSAIVAAGNMSAVSATLPPGDEVSLGGTTLAADANDDDLSITVPYDGAGGAVVNGIGAGATIVVGLNEYLVAGVAKNAAANTATITLTTAITGGKVDAGQIVGERRVFDVTVPSGTVTAGGSGTQTVTLTATARTAPNPARAQQTPTVLTVNRPALTVSKLVSVDGTTFDTTASASPDTVLVYKVVASNGGSSPASAVAFTDIIPTYLEYQVGSGKYATSAATTYAAATDLTEGAGGFTWTPATSTLAYDPGAPTGTVAGGGVLVLFYQAKIR